MGPPARFNFTADVLERLARERPRGVALRTISSEGARRRYTFQEVAHESTRAAGTLAVAGVSRGDVVLTLIGPRPEWVFALLGSWRLGAVALPCPEQLRSEDIALRIEAARPKVALTSGRNLAQLEAAVEGHGSSPTIINVDAASVGSDAGAWPAVQPAQDRPAIATSIRDPALTIFTSGTAGEPRGAVHTHRYLWGQRVQAEHWLGARPGDLVWCTAASGWSKSARNSFVAPWMRGAACLLHDGRFDPAERLALIAEEGANVLCQVPTEYRMLAKRTSLGDERPASLRRLVSAGEALDPEVMRTFREAWGLEIHDGYGQTETGQLTGTPPGEPARPGSMGKPLPDFKLEVRDQHGSPTDDGELCVDGASVPTFFSGYLGEKPLREQLWRTGDRVRRDGDGYLWFEGRLDDVILSAGYRIGPFEVESALVRHPAVLEAAAVAAPDPERGSVVRAVVVPRDGVQANERLVRQLQEHVKQTTAPYKYPRLVEFRDSLPKTPSGKIKRAALREETPQPLS